MTLPFPAFAINQSTHHLELLVKRYPTQTTADSYCKLLEEASIPHHIARAAIRSLALYGLISVETPTLVVQLTELGKSLIKKNVSAMKDAIQRPIVFKLLQDSGMVKKSQFVKLLKTSGYQQEVAERIVDIYQKNMSQYSSFSLNQTLPSLVIR